MKNLNEKSKIIKFYYKKNCELEAFRKAKLFKKYSYSLYLNNKKWLKNDFINSNKNLSTPTKIILIRYSVSIASAIIEEISSKNITTLIFYKQKGIDFDYLTIKIINFLKKKINIKIIVLEKHFLFFKNKKRANKKRVRIAANRGLFLDFKEDKNSYWWHINNLFNIVFNNLNISKEYKKYLLEHFKNHKDIKHLYLTLYSYEVKQKKFIEAKETLKLVFTKINNKFQKLNLTAFYILKKYGKSRSYIFLNKKIGNRENIINFLNKKNDKYESLLFKNFAFLSKNKYLSLKILSKCLKNTPNDSDLLFNLLFNFNFGDEKYYVQKLITNGYFDKKTFSLAKQYLIFNDLEKIQLLLYIYFNNLEIQHEKYILSSTKFKNIWKEVN